MRLVVPIHNLIYVALLTSGVVPMSVLGSEAMPSISIDVSARPARSINTYSLFRDVARQIPNEGLISYDINTSLFADYAGKHRFLYLPPDARVGYQPTDAFDFPIGTVLIKTFTHLHDRRDPGAGERILETRLLMHRPEGWVGYPYVWNEDLSDARLAVAGARIPVSWIHDDGSEREILYAVPNMNECKFCHVKDDVMGPIGPSARQLNRMVDIGGASENQLTRWIRNGVINDAPADLEGVPTMVPWDDIRAPLALRARSYLDGNCAHCHRPGGDAAPTGLDFLWSQQDPQAYGINRKPTAAGPASRGYRFAISPSHPEKSFLISRMRATEPGLLMPRAGRTIPHDEGIALMEEWIASMDPGLDSPTFYDVEN
jgi:uncharacterized repeat protein (TIGR03806 family)